ncbi:MAG: deoxycytidylate deaminase [Candidatus Aenigmatarchaeota archaeon]
MRIEKDRYYLEIAKAVALRSPCIRRKYGAIVVKNDSIVSTGYNGPARGSTNCEIGCAKEILNLPHYSGYDYCPAVHAEENCIANAARNGSSVLGGTLYLYGIDAKTGKPVAGMPCPRCKRLLINAGIKDVVTINDNEDIVRFYVEEWSKEDKENYEKIIQELMKKK